MDDWVTSAEKRLSREISDMRDEMRTELRAIRLLIFEHLQNHDD